MILSVAVFNRSNQWACGGVFAQDRFTGKRSTGKNIDINDGVGTIRSYQRGQ